MLDGTIPEEKGKVFDCLDDDIASPENQTVITRDNECVLLYRRSYGYSAGEGCGHSFFL